MKNFLQKAAALSAAVLMLTSCSAQPKGDRDKDASESNGSAKETVIKPSGEYPISDETLTFNCFVDGLEPNVTLENNYVVKYLEDKLNVKLNMEVAAGPESKTLALTSGNYADIIFATFTSLDIINYGENQKIFIPITDYIKDYAQELQAEMERDPIFRAGLLTNDNNIYSIPDIRGVWHGVCNPKTWINTEWLKKVDMNMPETTDEYYNVLKAFKEKDPNGNGKADEIPMSGAFTGFETQSEKFLLNAFTYTDMAHFLNVENDKVQFVANTNEYKEGLAYIKKLCDEGLLDIAAFTQDNAQLQQLGRNPGEVILGSYTAANVGAVIDLQDMERSKQYAAILPLKGPNGSRYTVYQNPSFIQNYPFVITDRCKYPEAAVRIGDFMLTEEHGVMRYYGEEGVGWRKANEGEIGRNGKPAKYAPIQIQRDPNAIINDMWQGSPNSTGIREYRESWAVANMDEFDPTNLELRLANAMDAYMPYIPKQTLPPFFLEKDESEALSQLQVQLVDYVKQSTTRFICGDLNLDKDWEAYLSALDSMGLANYISMNQKGFDSFAAKRDSAK